VLQTISARMTVSHRRGRGPHPDAWRTGLVCGHWTSAPGL